MAAKFTYPNADAAQFSYAALDQYRQAIVLGEPLPIEWLVEALTNGVEPDLRDYRPELAEAEQRVAEAQAAAEAAAEAARVIGGDEPEPEEIVEEKPKRGRRR